MEAIGYVGIGVGVLVLVGVWFLISMLFRRVVSTNEVHIVQAGSETKSYGKDTGNGNVYTEWPSWLPIIGLSKMVLPVSNFDIDLKAYEAYDQGRLPFLVDIKAFFHINNSAVAAQRVSSFNELKEHLKAIVQGAVRTILASHTIDEIMAGRSTFGVAFTKEVEGQLANWGVEAVKNIELMDIKDATGSQVIHNIMEKKKSFIEMESRKEVALNQKAAQIAEIEAQREIDLQEQEAKQQVGLRTTAAEREVQLAQQKRDQDVKEQEKTTKEKEMSVLQVAQVRQAEITKQTKVIVAEQEKQVAVVVAQGKLEATKLDADGKLETAKREAEGTLALGKAKAEAETAMQLAPVQAQTTLAKEIGENKEYQDYMTKIEQIKANRDIGIEQAKSLNKADIKIIANSGSIPNGMTGAMDMFSSQGGMQIGAMLEGLANTETGKALLKTVGVNKPESKH